MRTNYHIYTNEDKEWLKDKWLNTNLSSKEIADLYNITFNPEMPLNDSKISDLMTKRLKIKRGFNSTQYGFKEKEHRPLGTIVTYYYKGIPYKYIKVDNKKYGNLNQNYIPLQRYIYEKEYGCIKENEFVIFLDGNSNNFDLNNLAKVDRKTNAILSSRGWHRKGIITKAGITIIENENLIKERK